MSKVTERERWYTLLNIAVPPGVADLALVDALQLYLRASPLVCVFFGYMTFAPMNMLIQSSCVS